MANEFDDIQDLIGHATEIASKLRRLSVELGAIATAFAHVDLAPATTVGTDQAADVLARVVEHLTAARDVVDIGHDTITVAIGHADRIDGLTRTKPDGRTS
ncbi:hypothetical protein [Antrihabitans stalactiti]|uniref:Uncharacterized protein n=1 Tax=Antrihabitans stalactiti TaxID=2584121 RepID=A0A848KE11_9NOCA|nr:hypothetical protein [Antrihabitans stalactiti]NMN95848.1 hypothetical protein [Antrihabitans stalactiti]